MVRCERCRRCRTRAERVLARPTRRHDAGSFRPLRRGRKRIAYEEVHAQRREGRDDAPHDPIGAQPAVSASELVRAMRERNGPRRAEVLRHVAFLRRLAERLRKAVR